MSSTPDPEPLSKRTKYVPKHRHVPERALVATPKKVVRNTVVMSSVAVAVTGVAVSGGVLSGAADVTPVAGDVGALAGDSTGDSTDHPTDGSVQGGSVADTDRAPVTSRSADRRAADPAKAAALSVASGPAMAEKVELSSGDPRDIARALLPQYGFSSGEFECLDALWVSESDWRVDADNPTSSAYGIPQALTSMHELPADYMTNPVSQIEWGLGYIRDTYGSPCSAWSFKQGNNWY